MSLRLVSLVCLAMFAFAGNSLLCRLALKQTSIDPLAFTTLRLLSGAVILGLAAIIEFGKADKAVSGKKRLEGSWLAAMALLIYAASFSYAYTSIPAGTGALLLFAAIQISMILYGLWKGERLSVPQQAGFALAIMGFVVLVLPGVGAPSLTSALLMTLSGVAWGGYSLLGRKTRNPTLATAGNFIRSAFIITGLFFIFLLTTWPEFHVPDTLGLGYAVASGALTSGVGYVIWYAVVKHLQVTQAATIQLSVPVIAAFGGALFLDEPLGMALILSSVLILAGIALVIMAPRTKA